MRLHPVIIGLAEGVEFMVVAASASDCHPQESRADDVRHFGQHFIFRAGDILIARVLAKRSEAVESARNQVRFVLGVDFVAGELFFHELIVRLVVIEALDDVIPVTIGVRAVHVVLIAIGFRETNHIQPVPAPLLAVMRRSQADGPRASPKLSATCP